MRSVVVLIVLALAIKYWYWIVGAIVVIAVVSNFRRWWLRRRRDLEYVKSGMAAIDLMPGVEFENYIAAQLRSAGYTVAMTPATGDYGVDLIARKGRDCVAIQCKRYGKPVGVAAVQQVVAGAMHHRCTTSMVVSNREFTPAAKRLAGTAGCRLVGRAELQKWTR